MNQNQTYPYSIGSCTKISRYRQLNAWRMEITTVQETFSCKITFFKIDQLIAENPKSSKQTFNLSHVNIPRGQVHQGDVKKTSYNRNVGREYV